MSTDEITKIRVGGNRTGIIGLKYVLSEVAKSCGAQTDEEIRRELLKRLGRHNYIPDSSREKYGRAFLREFKKFTGQSAGVGNSDEVKIKVLGPGCASCNKLEQDLIAVMAEMGMAADLEHVTDIAEIGSYGVMGTPALVINREVKAVGSVPPKPKLKKWLQEAFSQKPSNQKLAHNKFANAKENIMEIKVLGPGCPRCQQTEEVVKEAVAEAGVDARIEKVTDTLEIAGYGVFGTPAVVMDGEVKSVGKIPNKDEIKSWLAG